MFRAPLLMAGAFSLTAVAVGIGVAEPASFLAVAVFGAFLTLPLGYLYVGMVEGLRRMKR